MTNYSIDITTKIIFEIQSGLLKVKKSPSDRVCEDSNGTRQCPSRVYPNGTDVVIKLFNIKGLSDFSSLGF
jgi:hypothetical protein